MKFELKSLFALAAIATLSPIGAALAEDGPYATFEIKIEENPAVSEVSPVVTSPITKNTVAFHIINNSNKQIYFVNDSDKSYVPLVSNNTVTAPYAPGQEYKVVDVDGNPVATWHLGAAPVAQSTLTSASASQFADWGNTLQRVIENQKVSYQEPPAKSEPHYYGGSSSRRGDSVRGYW